MRILLFNQPFNLNLFSAPPNLETDFEYKAAIYLKVHNQSELPFTLDGGINIKAGQRTYVAINRIFTSHLEKPYSNCLKNLESGDPDLKRYFGYFQDLGVDYYDQNFCFKICAQDQLLKKCDCMDLTTPAISNASYCESDVQLKCLSSFQAYFKTSDISGICKCPIQCEMVEYELTSSFATFPTYTYLQNLATDKETASFFPQNVTKEELISFANVGFLKLTVNYDNLYYTLYEDKPAKTLDAIIGEIGGQLGLCGGISLLNAMEILGILVSYCYRYYHLKKKSKNLKESDNIGSLDSKGTQNSQADQQESTPRLINVEIKDDIV